MKIKGIILLILTNIGIKAEVSYGFSNEPALNNLQTVAVSDTMNKQELLKEVRRRGRIDIWVHYKVDDYIQEHELDGFQRTRQRHEIVQLHNNLLSSMRTSNLQFRITNKMKSIPRIAMFADEETLKYLFESPLVEKVTKVELGKAH